MDLEVAVVAQQSGVKFRFLTWRSVEPFVSQMHFICSMSLVLLTCTDDRSVS